jgi:hypothetical protein
MHELLSHFSCIGIGSHAQLYIYIYMGYEEEDRDGYGGWVALAGEAGHVQGFSLTSQV